MPLQPLISESPVIVYIDFKSPYAYLAVEPTRALERELSMKFDWRPFVLDIPSYLGSARLDRSGKVGEQNRSTEQWSGVKYAYYDCRRYASLRNMTIRGTVKIWDTNLAATAMLWARQHNDETLQHFVDLVYVPFWKRDLDLEDMGVIESLLDTAGADSTEFSRWAPTEGMALNAQLQREAFSAGIYGVPTYVVEDELYFGREHLPRVRWHLSDKSEPAPDIAYTLPVEQAIRPVKPQQIIIGIDNTLDSLLAVPSLKALLDQHDLTAEWIRVESRKPGVLPPFEDQSRSARHKHFRVRNLEASLRRYAPQGVAHDEMAEAVGLELKRLGITLQSEGPADVTHPAMPGIVVKIDEELFIGRQHLPLLTALLG